MTVLLLVTVFLKCEAQYISPPQLAKLFDLYHSGRPDQAESYLYSISPRWTIDQSSITNQPDLRTLSWVNYDASKPGAFGMYSVKTISQPGKAIDMVGYFTDNPNYFGNYVDAIKSKCDLIEYKKDQSDGEETSVYKLGQLYFILAREAPNAKGKVLYKVTIQVETMN